MDEQRSWRLLRRLRWALRPVFAILLAFATLPVQASSAPLEPYSCQLYVDAQRQCAVGSYGENNWRLLARRSTGLALLCSARRSLLDRDFAPVDRAMGSYLGGCRFVGVGRVALA